MDYVIMEQEQEACANTTRLNYIYVNIYSHPNRIWYSKANVIYFYPSRMQYRYNIQELTIKAVKCTDLNMTGFNPRNKDKEYLTSPKVGSQCQSGWESVSDQDCTDKDEVKNKVKKIENNSAISGFYISLFASIGVLVIIFCIAAVYFMKLKHEENITSDAAHIEPPCTITNEYV